MARVKFKMPQLSENVTPEMLSDELGRVRAAKNYLDKLEEFYKTAIKARWPQSKTDPEKEAISIQGEFFLTTKEVVSQSRLNKDKLLEHVDANTLQKCYVDLEYDKIGSVRTATVEGEPIEEVIDTLKKML